MEHPRQIHRDYAVPNGGIEVEKPGSLTDARAIEQHVEPAEFAHRRGNRGVDRGTVAHVEAERRSTAAAGANLHSRGLCRCGIDIGTDHRCALTPETEGTRSADPAPRAGNQCDLSSTRPMPPSPTFDRRL
jgi:hypothetical protein